ncbi:MAG: B12-binding domain-containing protein [Pirellula sp.]
MDQLLSPKQIAEAIGASESSLKRWCDQGLIMTVKTAGGHRRIPVQEALRFVREQNREIVAPHILSMPATTDRKSRRIEGSADRLTEALLSNNELACHAILFDLFLAGESVGRIFDEVIAVAFRSIGDRWECHEAEIYQERSACEIMLRLLHELRSKQVAPAQKFMALGATKEGDHYVLPVSMAEIVLRSVDWDARLLGTSIPFHSMVKAIERHSPRLFWLSVSCIADETEFVAGFHQLSAAAAKTNTAIVVGGRALTPEIRKRLTYSAFCDTMRHLEEFGKTLRRQADAAPKKSRTARKKD